MAELEQDRRAGFRISVGELADAVAERLIVHVIHGARSRRSEPLDFSLSGILVVDPDATLGVGDRVVVHLRFDDRYVLLPGAVVRTVQGGATGIHFPDSVKNGEFDPPDELARIHRAVEHAWLQSRSGRARR